MTSLFDNISTKIILIIVFSTASFSLFSQNGKLSKANRAIDIAREFPDSSILISKQLLSSVTEDNDHLKGLAYYGLGEGYYYNQEYDSALAAYKNALKYFIAINDTIRLASTYNNIGLLHFYKADYGLALDAYLTSLSLEKKKNNRSGIAKSHQNIGLIYGNWGRYEQELEHSKLALDIYKELNDSNSIANMENNIGIIYVRQDKFKEALKHYQKALQYFTLLNDLSGKASALSNIGNDYLYLNNTDIAIKYINRAIKIFKQINNKRGLLHAYSAMGEAYAKKGNKRKAIEYYLKSEDINKSLGFKQAQVNNLKYLHKSYKDIGDYKNANRVLETLTALKDSIFDEEKFTTLADLEKKYNLQKSKQEAMLYKARNEKQKLLLFIAAGSFLFIIIMVIILYQNRTLKEREKRLIMEQRSLRSQMNPHFIFNALSAIQCMVLENKPNKASKYLSDFTKLIRKVLQYSRKDRITLKQEKELLQEYFNLQNIRFDNKIKFNITTNDNISDDKTMISPMLAQPFIENAFEHGQLANFEDGMINISFTKKEDKLVLSIEDNGIGINNTMKNEDAGEYKSMALKITRERLNLLNTGKNGDSASLQITDLSNDNKRGTKVVFSVPFEEID